MSVEQSANPNGSHPMDFFLTQDFDLIIPKTGETYRGIVVAHNQNNEILVDIGAKSEGIISNREVDSLPPEVLQELAIGCEVPVYVLAAEDDRGNILLSYGQAVAAEGWDQARRLQESQDVFKAKITGFNKGGLLTNIHQVRAFIPASQLGLPLTPGSDTEAHLKQFVGQTLETRVIEVDPSRNRLILSARDAVKKMREKKRTQMLTELTEGDICEGKVVNLESFGAFVDIGGLQGLVHLSELSWKRINNPAEILEVGDTIEVYILGVDNDKQRVALSIKRLESDPWTTIDEQYKEGQLVEVTITKLERYGAFAQLNDDFGLEGLIHISELADERVQKPSDVIRTKQVVTARIIRIDRDKRQLGLSLKQVVSGQFMDMDLAEVADENELTSEVQQ